MLICKVLKPLVSTNRIPGLEHKHLQVVLDGSSKKVAVDAVGCKPDDWVLCVGSSAAREAAVTPFPKEETTPPVTKTYLVI